MVNAVLKASRCNLCVSHNAVGDMVMEIVEACRRERPWMEEWIEARLPSKKWWRCFLRRYHPLRPPV